MHGSSPGLHHDDNNPKAENKKKISKPYIIHRSANAIVVAGQNQMFKTERVSYTFGFSMKLEFLPMNILTLFHYRLA